MGGLEDEELKAYDRLFQSRPPEPIDNRIVIVGITEQDLQRYRQYPFSDAFLANFIQKIKAQNPRVIGLDLIRDFPKPPGHEKLNQLFKTTPNLIGAGQLSDRVENKYIEIAFPPVLKQLHRAEDPRIADIAMPLDKDYVTRKAFIHPITDTNRPDLASIPSLGAAVARKYLAAQNIEATAAPDGWWMRLGKVIFYPFKKNDGGYANETDGGYQVLLNWRGTASSFKHVSVSEVMNGKISSKEFTNRIVLIGAYAPSLKDTLITPYVRQDAPNNDAPYGVEVHAQLASQIVSAVLDERPLIQVMPDWAEDLWIVFWVASATIGIWGIRNLRNPFVLLVGAIAYCGVLTLIISWVAVNAFSIAWWIPSVPALYGVGASGILSITNILAWQRVREKEDNEQRLEQRIKEREQEIEEKNQIILAQSYLAFLGNNFSGFCHECNNIFYNFSKSTRMIKDRVDSIYQFLKEQELIDKEREKLLNFLEYLADYQKKEKDRGLAYIKRYLPITPDESNYYLTKEDIDLNTFVKEGLWLNLKHKQKQDAIEISCLEEYDDSILNISMIPSELNFVLDNLINNAWDALKLKSKKKLDDWLPTLKAVTKKKEDKIQIIIQDNGIGVAPEIEAEIFKFYFTTKLTGEGMGMGLFLARKIIVGRYKGNLYYQKVETEESEETQFIVEIPI
jgi:CHASE2 domain-containing sensor protein